MGRFSNRMLVAFFPFVFVAFAAQAGPLSRARTEGHRLDDGKPVAVDSLYVYSFLQEGAGDDKRLARDIDKYVEVVVGALREKGLRTASRSMPPGTLTLDAARRGVNGVEGFERTLAASEKAGASTIAREYRDAELALPTGYRLLLLPDKVSRNSGLYWGTRMINVGDNVWFVHGVQASGVPSYSFRVYWLLERTDDQSVAAGTTTGILDIRGFPAKPMAGQMLSEMERLGIRWQGQAP